MGAYEFSDAPLANDDAYTTDEDTLLVIAAPGVLTNDIDDDSLTAILDTDPSNGTLTLNADGSFTYTPALNFNGTDSFIYYANDGSLDSNFATVTITVNTVNDAPSFTKGSDVTVSEDSGYYTEPNWATDISPGPSDEFWQTVSFNVSNDNNSLFSVQPAISNDGTLTFTPAPDSFGSATVTVIAQDDGGTANGGRDTSAPQTFVITVTVGPAVSWDIDDNGVYDALTDGLLTIRYLFGFRGSTLIDSAVAPDANRSNAAEIEAYLAAASVEGMLDIDGNGTDDALTDGLLIMRYLFGFRGDTLIDGAVAPDAIRTTADDIEVFIESYMPTLTSAALIVTESMALSSLQKAGVLPNILLEETNSNGSTQMITPDPLAQTICLGEGLNETAGDSNINNIGSTQVDGEIAAFSNDSDGDIESKVGTTEDDNQPVYVNDNDISIKENTPIEIKGPPSVETGLDNTINSYLESERPEVDPTILEEYAAEVEPSGTLYLPGLETVDPNPSNLQGQVIYLDFGGEEDVTYNGPVVVDDIDIPEFSAKSAGMASHEDELIEIITPRVAESVDLYHGADADNLLLAVAYEEDFEQGWGGWSPDNGVWEVGVPTSGPGAAHSGTNCVATVLDGAHPKGTDSRLISPEIDLPTVSGNERLELRFWQYYSYGLYDSGKVQISTWDGSSWNAWTPLDTLKAAYSDGAWLRVEADLMAYADETVRIGFLHTADDPFNPPRLGWYIDDVQIWHGVPTFDNLENFDDDFEGWNADAGIWQIGEPTSGPETAHSGSKCVATGLYGNYPANRSSRLISPVMILPTISSNEELQLRFWQWCSYYPGTMGSGGHHGQVQISRWDGSSWSEWTELATVGFFSDWSRVGINLVEYAGETVRLGFYHSTTLSSNTGLGWYIDDVEIWRGVAVFDNPETFEAGWGDWNTSNGVWEFGEPTSGPGAAHSGTNCAATVLAGDYAAYTKSRLISPVIDLPTVSGDERLELRFWEWYSYVQDYGHVEISMWDDINRSWSAWTELATADYSSGWSRVGVDLAAYAGRTVRFSFFHTHGYSSSPDPGWYIDDVQIWHGVPTVDNPETFEGGWGDWNTNAGIWQIGQIGEPTSGPGAAHGGTNCAATVLAGNYPASGRSRLITPAMKLPTVSGNERVELRFWHWCSYGDVYAGRGQVQMSTWDGSSWSEWTELATPAPQQSNDWSRVGVDLTATAYAGQTVRFAFYHSAGGWEYSGWYIDDVQIWHGVPTVDNPETFEDGWGDWNTDAGIWQIGTPTSGPGAAYSGNNCAGTVLAGDYPDDTNSRLIRAVTELPTVSGNERVELRFWHWCLYAGGSGAQVQISWLLEDSSWGDWTTLASPAFQQSSDWSRVGVDLTAYAGQTVRIAFYHLADFLGHGIGAQSLGWYIDDVEIWHGVPAFDDPETFEDGWGDWNTDRGVWQIGEPMSGPGADHSGAKCAATVLAGDYPYSGSSRLISPVINLPTVSGNERVELRFWQWYSYGTVGYSKVHISTWDGSSWGELTELAKPASPAVSSPWSRVGIDLTEYAGRTVRVGFFHVSYDYSSPYSPTQGPGWYIDDVQIWHGVPTVDNPETFEDGWEDWNTDAGVWQIGEPTNGPMAARSGAKCAGTVLAGLYSSNGSSRLIRPATELPTVSGNERVELRFWQWYSYEGHVNDRHKGQVEIATWDDSSRSWGTWQPLVVAAYGPASSDWSRISVDLTAYASETVSIGFRHIAHKLASTYPPTQGPGWYIDDVQIWHGVPRFDNPETFEDGWGDWNTDAGVWQIGEPTSGPGSAYSGTKCAATVLAGNYPADTFSLLISPRMKLPTVGGSERLELRFWQWYSYASGNGGHVYMSRWEGSSWSAWEWLARPAPPSSTGDWSRVDIDLAGLTDYADYAGETVRFGFYHTADSSKSTGWYIDDVQLYGPFDDPYEENDTPATAWDFTAGNQQWLSSYGGSLGMQWDDDWYEISVTQSYEQVLINCQFTHADGNIDVELYDAVGTLLDSSTSTTDSEHIDYTVTAGGTYYIRVYHGYQGNTYDLWWNLDESTPPTVLGWELADDTGSNPTDKLTKDSTPQLTFTFSETIFGQDSDVVVLGPGSNPILPDSISGWGSNTLVIVFTTALAVEGEYTVTLNGTGTIKDGAGNALNGGVNEVVHFTLDTTAPVVTVNTLLTNDTTPELTGTVDDPDVSVEVTVVGNSYSAVNNGDGTWTLADDTISPALADGTYDVEVAATDLAGNTGTDLSFDELVIRLVNWDIDDNGIYDALTDGLLTIRYLFGFRGSTLIDSAVAPDANRSNAAEIEAYLAAASVEGMLDIDGNGTDDALTDGLLIMRYLFGFRGDTLIDGAVAPDAIRTTADDIEVFIESYMPTLTSAALIVTESMALSSLQKAGVLPNILLEETNSNGSTQMITPDPLAQTICLGEGLNETAGDSNINNIGPTQVDGEIAAFSNDSDGDIESNVGTPEDDSQPIYVDNNDISIEETSPIEIRGPPTEVVNFVEGIGQDEGQATGRSQLPVDLGSYVPLPLPDKEGGWSDPGTYTNQLISYDLRTGQELIGEAIDPVARQILDEAAWDMGSEWPEGELLLRSDEADIQELQPMNFTPLTLVENPEEFPWNVNVKLYITFPGDSHVYQGSGVLIDALHFAGKMLILTLM